jgi:hypothetical protein
LPVNNNSSNSYRAYSSSPYEQAENSSSDEHDGVPAAGEGLFPEYQPRTQSTYGVIGGGPSGPPVPPSGPYSAPAPHSVPNFAPYEPLGPPIIPAPLISGDNRPPSFVPRSQAPYPSPAGGFGGPPVTPSGPFSQWPPVSVPPPAMYQTSGGGQSAPVIPGTNAPLGGRGAVIPPTPPDPQSAYRGGSRNSSRPRPSTRASLAPSVFSYDPSMGSVNMPSGYYVPPSRPGPGSVYPSSEEGHSAPRPSTDHRSMPSSGSGSGRPRRSLSVSIAPSRHSSRPSTGGADFGGDPVYPPSGDRYDGVRSESSYFPGQPPFIPPRPHGPTHQPPYGGDSSSSGHRRSESSTGTRWTDLSDGARQRRIQQGVLNSEGLVDTTDHARDNDPQFRSYVNQNRQFGRRVIQNEAREAERARAAAQSTQQAVRAEDMDSRRAGMLEQARRNRGPLARLRNFLSFGRNTNRLRTSASQPNLVLSEPSAPPPMPQFPPSNAAPGPSQRPVYPAIEPEPESSKGRSKRRKP